MEPFEPKPDFEYPIQKPSFDSVVRQKRREAELKAEQERYKVANQRVPEEQEDEPIYTEMEQKMMDEARELSLVGHLSELRKRLIIMAVAVVIGTCISYYYVDFLLEILLKPAGKLYYMKPTEAFFTYMKVSIVGGLIIAAPIILHQIWLFVKPALTVREKQLVSVLYFLIFSCYQQPLSSLWALLQTNYNRYFPLVSTWTLYYPLYYPLDLSLSCR